MPDADKSLGQYMQKKTSDEFHWGESEVFLSVVVGVVLAFENDSAAVRRDESGIGDGYAVGVPTEVFEYLFLVPKGRFGVNDPIFGIGRCKELFPLGFLFQMRDFADPVDFAFFSRFFEEMEKLSPKEFPHHLHRKKKIFLGCNPFLPISCQSPCADDTMEMGMKLEILSPCMKDRGESHFGAKVLGVFGELMESLGCGAEKEVEGLPFVVKHHSIQLGRESENHMKVRDG